jgi:hypothetical protein
MPLEPVGETQVMVRRWSRSIDAPAHPSARHCGAPMRLDLFPVTMFHPPDDIRAWQRELARLREQHRNDPEALACTRRAERDAESLLDLATNKPAHRASGAAALKHMRQRSKPPAFDFLVNAVATARSAADLATLLTLSQTYFAGTQREARGRCINLIARTRRRCLLAR